MESFRSGSRLLATLILLAWGLGAGQTRASAAVGSSSIVVNRDGTRLYVVNPDSATMSVVDTSVPVALAEIPVGNDPRSVAVVEAEGIAFVANRGSGTVTVVDLRGLRPVAEIEVGAEPCALVELVGADRIAVALEGDDRVGLIDIATRILTGAVAVPARPAGLASSADGSVLYVTHLLSPVLTVIDVATMTETDHIHLYPDSNIVRSIVTSPSGAVGYVPHTRSNSTNPNLTFDTTVFPLVSRVDLIERRHMSGRHLALDTIDPPGVGLPSFAAVSIGGDVLFVVNSASNDLTVIDLVDDVRIAHIVVGRHPLGIAMAPDGRRAYVNNALDGSVSIIDTVNLEVVENVAVTAIPLPPALLDGKRLFHSSDDPRLARAQWIACASCHVEGGHDGRTWSFGFAGPRNTTSLLGMVQTYPLRWSAEWDEAADLEFAIVQEQFGRGLLGGAMHEPLGPPNGGRSTELDRLAAYLDSLTMAGNQRAGSFDPAAVDRGRAHFEDPVTECRSCHPPPYFTDFASHDVGTADGPGELLGPEMDTPTLRGLSASGPYLHDGSAPTLGVVLTTANPDDRHGVTSHLDDQAIADLEIYLLSLPTNNHACRSCDPALPEPPTPDGHRDAIETIEAVRNSEVRRSTGRITDRMQVSGRVTAGGGGAPVEGALVTIRATEHSTSTDQDGLFAIVIPATADQVEVAAWTPGHYIASEVVTPPVSGIELELRHHHTEDDPSYEWLDPHPDSGSGSACGRCHPSVVDQWSANAHGRAVSNPRFFSFYNGTDVGGTRVVEPGYRLDFPDTTGNCAACHAPGSAANAPLTTDMNSIRGMPTAGIHCDLCHKVGGVYLRALEGRRNPCQGCHPPGTYPLESALGVPYPNMPGIMSIRLLRPPPEEQVFFGPYPDIHDPDAYLPIYHESAFCAPCHEFSFWGTPIYTSFGEWLASTYSDPEQGQTCQDCHMPPNGDRYFAIPGQGGLEHPPETIPAHVQLGADSVDLLRNTLDVAVDASRDGDVLAVSVTVTNTGAGHHVPTDHPGRHVLLIVEARNADGDPIALVDGPIIPGLGGDLSGLPGVVFAKVLEDVNTAEWPVVSYWKPTIIRTDTRLPALASSSFEFRFVAPTPGEVSVSVRVVFRRLFQNIAARYDWPVGDVMMEQAEVTIGG